MDRVMELVRERGREVVEDSAGAGTGVPIRREGAGEGEVEGGLDMDTGMGPGTGYGGCPKARGASVARVPMGLVRLVVERR